MNARKLWWSVFGMLAIAFVQGFAYSDDELTIVHINVAQGDATLILGPADAAGNRVSVLVDAGDSPRGGRDGGEEVLRVLRAYQVTELDFFLLTHFHSDHEGGAVTGSVGIFGRSFILGEDNVPGNPGDDDGDGMADWLDPSEMRKPDPEELGTGDDIRVHHFVDRGDEARSTGPTNEKLVGMANAFGVRQTITTSSEVNGFEIDLGNGARMECIAANGFVRDRPTRVPRISTENERSLCFWLSYRGFDYVIGGDTIGRDHASEDAEVESAIAVYLESQGAKIDVIQVNHHGGNNASSTDYLASLEPEVAIISLGNDNRHHHPHHETLQRLADAGVERIYQTEWGTTQEIMPKDVRRIQAIAQGDVVLTTDGDSYTITTSWESDTDG